jgi:putative transcriptional regulator
MVQVLQNKKLATCFQILVAIAAGQPNIQQKSIAAGIGVTPQAVSEYVAELTRDGLLEAPGRSRYRVTKEGVNWIIRLSRELEGYCGQVNQAVTRMSVFAALAEDDLTAGQTVGLVMRDGLLYACRDAETGAIGVTTDGAKAGTEVGIADLSGIVTLEPGRVTLGRIPAVDQGGSAAVNHKKLATDARGQQVIAAIGLEALVALRRAGITPAYFYGVAGAVIEAAQAGLNPFVACTADEVTALAQRLEKEHLSYQIVEYHA